MIKLTHVFNTFNGEKIEPMWIPVDGVIVRPGSDGGTILKYSSNAESHFVSESPEEVVRKIMDYKIGMIDYKVLYDKDEAVQPVMDKLYKLAGLEQTP